MLHANDNFFSEATSTSVYFEFLSFRSSLSISIRGSGRECKFKSSAILSFSFSLSSSPSPLRQKIVVKWRESKFQRFAWFFIPVEFLTLEYSLKRIFFFFFFLSFLLHDMCVYARPRRKICLEERAAKRSKRNC